MSEETRQKKLAAARKKLREFQRKNSLLPPETKKKKKKKDGGSPETTTPDGCPSPEKIQDILKVLVSDLNRSNGVALSPLDKWKAPKDRAAPAAPPTDDTMSPDGVLDQCASPPLVASMASTQNHDVENGPSPLDGNMFSSTEGLRQLSQQLNGLVAESTAHVNGEVLASTTDTKFPEPSAHVNGEVLASIADTNSPEPSAHVNGEVLASTTDTKFPEPAAHVNMEIPASIADINSPESAPYINGEGVASTADTKSLESRYQELAVALESSKVENKQLCSKIEQLEQQNRETQDELQKEKKECEQKIWNERGSLRKQLQVHIQTIGILVSEKSELQTALYHTENAVRKREGMAQQFASRLQSSQQRIQELERTVTTLTAQQKQAKRKKDELSNDRDALTVELVKRNSTIDDLKQQKSELEEKLRVLMTEKSVTETGVEELQKKLEMSDLLLKQFSSPSPTTDDGKQQLQEALEERAQLETRVGQLQDTLKQLQVERDRYAENLKEDNAIWCRRMQQMTGQMRKLYDEKDDSMNRVRELEATVAELKSQIAVPPPQTAPAGPSEMEQQLQVEAAKLQKELESLAAQLQAQVQDNQNLSCLNQEQERRLLELEREAENWEQQTEQHKQILETMQSDRVTISRALSQNRELKEQLAELQNGFVKLSNENMEITSTLQTEQHTKNELAKNLGQLQEKLQELKEMVELKSQEAQSLQQQRDQYLSHLQQHVAACQQLAAEKEMLYRQVLQQTQLIEHLQQRETQDKAQADMVRQELQETQGQLEAANQENQKLQAQLREMALPGEGDGLDTEEEDKEAPKPKLSVPEDLDSREAMMAFFNSALASAQKEQAELRAQLKEQKLRCRRLAQLAAAPQHQLEEAKNLMEETPHVIDETEGLAEKTPNVINETEGIAEKNPDVMKTASGIMKKMPDVMDEMEGIAEKTPDVMKMASGIMEKTPDVMDEMEGIAEKTPDVMDEMEGIAEKTPDVMKTASGIMEKTPDVMDEMEGIAEKTPDVIDETAGFVEEVPPGNGGDCVPKEIHQSLQVAMDQLQDRFVKVMQEKADLKERLDELEHRCIQLSGETDTIGEYITLYQSQRAVMKQRHREKEEYISRLAKDKEEIKVKLLELQELLLRLVNERNEWYGRFLAAAQNSAGKPILALPAPQETGAANSQDGLDEVSLADSGEHIQGEALRVSASPEHPTEQKIMKLLREIQNPREHAGLGSKPCFPFFYRVDEHDQVKVLVI